MGAGFKTQKGKFVPRNPHKYVGNLSNITYRSSWELRFMQFCDLNENVVQWGSEEIQIPYVKPTDRRIHHYIPDFIMKYRDRNGSMRIDMVEIKPMSQSRITKKTNLADAVQVAINDAKWTAAQSFCASRGMGFRILTENELFRGKKK